MNERVTYVPCTGRNCTSQVMEPEYIEVDPLCIPCQRKAIKSIGDAAMGPKICVHPICNNVVTAGTSDYCTPCIQEFVRISY